MLGSLGAVEPTAIPVIPDHVSVTAGGVLCQIDGDAVDVPGARIVMPDLRLLKRRCDGELQ